MNVYEAINKRKNIRKFLNKEIPIETLKDILSNVILAPSSKNKQPWKFYVIKNDTKKKISNIILKHSQKYNMMKGTAIAVGYYEDNMPYKRIRKDLKEVIKWIEN